DELSEPPYRHFVFVEPEAAHRRGGRHVVVRVVGADVVAPVVGATWYGQALAARRVLRRSARRRHVAVRVPELVDGGITAAAERATVADSAVRGRCRVRGARLARACGAGAAHSIVVRRRGAGLSGKPIAGLPSRTGWATLGKLDVV